MGFTILPICTNCGDKTKSIAIVGVRFSQLSKCNSKALDVEFNDINLRYLDN